MLPYQPNCASVVLPPARPPPVPAVVPFPLPVWVAAVFFDSFSLESFFTGTALAISFFSESASLCSLSVFSGVGFTDGFGNALTKVVFLGEGVRAGLAAGVGFGFGVGFGAAFGVSFGLGFGVCAGGDVDVGVGFGVGS